MLMASIFCSELILLWCLFRYDWSKNLMRAMKWQTNKYGRGFSSLQLHSRETKNMPHPRPRRLSWFQQKGIFTAPECLCTDFCEMGFAGSAGCLWALQPSAAFLFGQGSSVAASLQRRRSGANTYLQSTPLPKSPFLSIGFWTWFYEPSTAICYWGATQVIRFCCPMPLLHLELNQSTISGN